MVDEIIEIRITLAGLTRIRDTLLTDTRRQSPDPAYRSRYVNGVLDMYNEIRNAWEKAQKNTGG